MNDLAQPRDWSRGKLLRWSVAGLVILLLVALRHRWFWGGNFGEWLNLGEAFGLVAFTFLAGTAMAHAVRQAGSLPLRFLLGAGIALALLAAAAPPFLSTDLFDYLSRGRLEHLGLNPYLATVQDHAADPRLAAFAALSEWPHWRMPYGPLMAVVQWALAAVDAPWVGVSLWKLLAAAAHVGAAWLFYRTLAITGDERQARRGLVLWLWNPLLLLEGVANAHNDVVVALLLMAMAFSVVRDRFAWAAVAFGGAMLFKHGIAPVGPLLLVLAWRRQRLAAFAQGTAIVAVLTAALWWRYFRDPAALDFVLRQAEVARASLFALTTAWFGAGAGQAVAILGALLALACLGAGLKNLRDARSFGGYALLTLVLFLLFSAPQFAPWYHLWWLPLVALLPVPPMLRVMELVAWLGPLSYLVWAGTRTFGASHQAWQFVLAALWPLGLVLLEWRTVLDLPRKSRPTDV